jgi:molecular chaperone HtpG
MPRIGTFVLESLTTGMYREPLETLREFVQNSADSIRQAESDGLIPTGRGIIRIAVDPALGIVSVQDNGAGIPTDLAPSDLLNLGASRKRLDVSAGFRGIGRLAGVAYSTRMTFRTSAYGEDVNTVVEIDSERLRQNINPWEQENRDLADILHECSSVRSEPGDRDSHFFQVTMEGVSDPAFMDWVVLEKYLSQVAPVDFNSDEFQFGEKIKEWAREHGFVVPTVAVIIQTPSLERQVLKPYGTQYVTRREHWQVKISDVSFFCDTSKHVPPFWSWYGNGDLVGMLSPDTVAGFRFRKNNILIGGADRVSELFAEQAQSNERFNGYYIGEIHVVDPAAVPNARRDDFEPAGAWPGIRSALAPFLRQRSEEVRSQSRERNSSPMKAVALARRLIDDVEKTLSSGPIPLNERLDLVARIRRYEDTVKKIVRTADLQTPLLLTMVNELEERREALNNGLTKSEAWDRLTPEEQRIVTTVLGVLYRVLDAVTFDKVRDEIMAEMTSRERES